MEPGIYIDTKSGAVYRVENLAGGLVFQDSRKITEQFVDGSLLPRDLVRAEEPLNSNLDCLMWSLEE